MHLPIGLFSVAFAVGVLYLLMALTVWAMLMRRHPRVPLALWSLGSVFGGLGLAYIGSRGESYSNLESMVTGTLLQLSLYLRIAALRVDLRRTPLPPVAMALATLSLLLFTLACLQGSNAMRVAVGTAILVAGSAALAWYAVNAGRIVPSRHGVVLAWAEAAAALALLARMVMVLQGHAPSSPAQAQLVQWVTLLILGSTSAVYSSLGYLGIALDRLAVSENQAQADKSAALLGRDEAVKLAKELRLSLASRDELIAEREKLLSILAHEVRQPLHNASGALQVARQVLTAEPMRWADAASADEAAATEPLARAQELLSDLHSVLDNTLAAASLLTGSSPLALQELELDLLVNLTLGDFNAEQRAHVVVERHTDLRSAELEQGLLRLALRNLLANAFRHGGPDVQVVLRIAERDEPAALLLEVIDDGPGVGEGQALPAGASLAAQSREQGIRGLGLSIVREVMALHGGALEVRRNARGAEKGLVFSLVLPLPGSAALPGPLAAASAAASSLDDGLAAGLKPA